MVIEKGELSQDVIKNVITIRATTKELEDAAFLLYINYLRIKKGTSNKMKEA
ncbi:MAG TPA: hypothetical protein PKA10_19810 [Selenomonadales bacterium]|nr:hypothetical protein [Selenomonadales bacterium]